MTERLAEHDWNPMTRCCDNCGITVVEELESPTGVSCLSERDRAWVQGECQKWLVEIFEMRWS